MQLLDAIYGEASLAEPLMSAGLAGSCVHALTSKDLHDVYPLQHMNTLSNLATKAQSLLTTMTLPKTYLAAVFEEASAPLTLKQVDLKLP